MSADAHELVRVDRKLAQSLIDDPSAPVVVISLERTPDGTADMLLQTPAVTDEMIEAGARAYYDAETEVAPPLDPPWEDAIAPVKGEYRKAAQIVLAAAFERQR